MGAAREAEEYQKARREDGGGRSHDGPEPRGQEKLQVARNLIAGK